VLVITRSGTTTEVIDVLTSLRGRDLVTTAIVATPGTPVTELADRTVLLPEVDEKSVVQTRFATSTVALLRASLGEDLSAAIDDARAVLAEDEDAVPGRCRRRRAGDLRGARLDHRSGRGGGPQAA
jgi:fructoselysine-6-P-deglycase FrlB-like protein